MRWVEGWAEGEAEDVDGGKANVFGVSGAAKTYFHDSVEARPVSAGGWVVLYEGNEA